MGGEGIEAAADKRCPSHSMVNTVGGKHLKALRRPNKGKKHNGNIPKDKDNRFKRLASLAGTENYNTLLSGAKRPQGGYLVAHQPKCTRPVPSREGNSN